MILSGYTEEWVRVFGRWESTAVQRYVRETLLLRKGADIARVVERVDASIARPAEHTIDEDDVLNVRSFSAVMVCQSGVRHIVDQEKRALCGWNAARGTDPCPFDLRCGRWCTHICP